MLKSYGVGGGWSNLVSAQGPLVLGLGLKGLGPGLDKKLCGGGGGPTHFKPYLRV